VKLVAHHINKLRHDQSGLSMIELAVVLPVLMTIGLGAMEFGNLIYVQHLIANGVRDGGRYAAGLPYDAGNATQTAANSAKIANIVTNGVDTGGTARVAGWLPGSVTVAYTTIDNSAQSYRGPLSLPVVTVSTSYSYQPLGFLGFLGMGAQTLTFSHQERVIGNR
jgi:Flp pilus assembly protein TadG